MKKKKKKIKLRLNKSSCIILLLQYIMSGLMIFTLIKSNFIGLKFLIPTILLLVFLDFLMTFCLFRSKKKKGKILLCGFSILLSIIYLVSSIVAIQVFSSMKKMFKNDSYINYSVIVQKESKYKKIESLDKKIIGFYVDDKYRESAKKVLNKNIAVEYIGYSTIGDLKNALLENEIDGIMLMDSYLELNDLEDDADAGVGDDENSSHESEVNNEDFDLNSKVIYNFKIKVDNSKNSKKIDLDKGSFAIYVSGQDSYASSVSETSRSDVNMLMVVNIKTKQILLISIPRDYYIKISSKGAYDKLTHISLYGSDEAMSSLGDLLDVKVDYFVKFNFTTFMKAVEYMLPLDVYSDYDFTTSVYDQTIGNSYTFSKGYNHITDGKMALQFVRARKNFAEGDRQRGINQSRFLRAVINKTSEPSVLLKYNKILKALEGSFLSNISNESIQEIAKYVLNNNGAFNISSIALDGSDANKPTYSGGSQPLYVMIPNTQSIEKAKNCIKKVLAGETLDIERDASEEADVKDTHTVTSKDIGKSYSYKPSYKKPSNSNIKKEEDIKQDTPDDNNLQDKNDQDNDKTDEPNKGEEEVEKPNPNPIVPPTDPVDPPSSGENNGSTNDNNSNIDSEKTDNDS